MHKGCSAGTFANATGTAECFQCAEGKYLNEINGTGCRDCPIREFTSTKGQIG